MQSLFILEPQIFSWQHFTLLGGLWLHPTYFALHKQYTLQFFADAYFHNFRYSYWDLQRCANNIKKIIWKILRDFQARICNLQVTLQHKLWEPLCNLLRELHDLLDFIRNLLELLPIFYQEFLEIFLMELVRNLQNMFILCHIFFYWCRALLAISISIWSSDDL